jgi:hypothetical protein
VAARRCRMAVDGTAAAQAFPPLSWLVGDDPAAAGARLDIWRGELDWWTGPAARLQRASIAIGGHPADAWDLRGMRGLLRAEMSVAEPANPPRIEEPLP